MDDLWRGRSRILPLRPLGHDLLDAALDDGDQRSVEFAVTVEEGLKSRRVFVCDGFKLPKIKGKLAFVHNIESDKGIKLRCAI